MSPEVSAKNQGFAYMKGWRDGAVGRAQSERLKNAVRELQIAYLKGYSDGQKAVTIATMNCETEYGFKFSIIREAGKNN